MTDKRNASLHCIAVLQISSAGLYYDKEWAEDKEIMKKTLPSAVDNLDSIHTDFPHTELWLKSYFPAVVTQLSEETCCVTNCNWRDASILNFWIHTYKTRKYFQPKMVELMYFIQRVIKTKFLNSLP